MAYLLSNQPSSVDKITKGQAVSARVVHDLMYQGPTCPASLFHGEDDATVPAAASARFGARLRRHRSGIELQIAETAGHVEYILDAMVGERPLLFDLLRPLLEEESDDEGRDREKDLARSE